MLSAKKARKETEKNKVVIFERVIQSLNNVIIETTQRGLYSFTIFEDTKDEYLAKIISWSMDEKREAEFETLCNTLEMEGYIVKFSTKHKKYFSVSWD